MEPLITLSSLLQQWMNLLLKMQNKIQSAFNFFDKNNDGIIDKNDLKQILEANEDLSFEDCMIDELINEWDLNGDGKIDYKEFYRWMSIKDDIKRNKTNKFDIK